MWTHNKPYQKSQKTEKSIEEHGRIALSRALNIGRVVGFIGSGVSIAYGRPTWTELIEHVLAELDRWRDDWKADWQSRSENLPPEILSLFDQIDFLIGRASGSTPSGSIELNRLAAQDLTTILEIIDSLFGAIGALSIPGPRLETLRENVAQFLMKNRSQISKERFYNNIPDQLETLNAIDWSSSYAEQDAYFQVVTGKTLNQQDIGELNPVHHIYETLRIRRFMTLNFDVEIERYLAKALGITVKAPGRAQEQLLSLIESESKGFKPNGNNRRIAIETGLERSLLTVTMAEENVGELVNFAMHPKAYSAQVFHLHGRIDDPENMVISERDYQRIYMPDDQGRRTFREALESVFAGNDVLFIGVGLRETDIMRPLRQFVSQDRSSDSEARRVFALMEQVVEFDPSIPPADQIRLDRQKEIQRTLRLNVQYGVHTIVYGESDARHARMACNALQAFAEGQISASDVRTHVEQALAQQDLARQLWDEKTGDSRLTFQKLVTDIEAEQIEEILRLDPLFYEEQSKRKAISGYARCLENRVRLRALCRELEALARRSADWWKEWRQMPRHREAIFREHRVNAACPIWVRHRADYCDIEADDPVPSTINKLRKLAGAQGELTAEGHRRVLCVVMERGAGKGALTNLLQQPVRSKDGQPSSTAYYETIFSGATYVGAFFAHLSFSMEFSSVIVALTRFVAGRLADVHGCSHSVQNEMEMSPGEALRRFSPEDSAPEETFSRGTHRLTLLRRLLNAFEKAPHRSGRRLFVCLSGVHRLCNEEGIARNPMHRAFFRLLSGYGLKTPNESPFVLPIDLLILSGNADHPIRYLNEECELESFDREVSALQSRTDSASRERALELLNSFDRQPNMGVAIRHCPLIEPIPWRERFWQFRGRDEKTQCATRILREWNTDSAQISPDPRTELAVILDPGSTPTLNRYLQTNVGFSAWVSASWRELVDFLGGDERGQALQSWMMRLDAAAARGGLTGALDEILNAYHQSDRNVGIEQAVLHDTILRHLALFTLPIEIGVLFDCPDIKQSLAACFPTDVEERILRRRLADAMDMLCHRSLIIRVSSKIHGPAMSTPKGKQARHLRFVLHSQLRDHLAFKMRLSVPDSGDRNDFQMTIYCNQPRDLPTPSPNHYELLRRILDGQISICRATLRPFYQLRQAENGCDPRALDPLYQAEIRREQENTRQKLIELTAVDERDDNEEPGVKLHSVAQRIRACYGLLRGAFSIGSISRLDGIEDDTMTGEDVPDAPLERFRGWLRALANVAVSLDVVSPHVEKALAGELSLTALGDPTPFFDNSEKKRRETQRLYRPLYREEVAWLYNERGLVSLVQGRLYDAMPLFDRAHHIIRHRRDAYREHPSFRAAERRIQLNHTIAHIERGNLAEARSILQAITQEVVMESDASLSTGELAAGYLGLVNHLTGNFEKAQSAYEAMIERANQANQLRLASIFNRHLSDLLRLLRKYEDADQRAEYAINTAMQSEQRDVLHLALVSKARIYRDLKKRDDALILLHQCEAYARRLGVPKLEAEAMQVLAEIMLKQGEETLAGTTAARAMALAGRHGMRLRKVSCITLYGDILEKRNQTDLARRVRDEARTYAERLGYQLKAGRLAEALGRQTV